MNIEVDCHTHTVASGHAYSTLLENVAAAAEQGLKLLAITDHGPAMPGAPHIWFFENLRALPSSINGVTILRGIEANIINDEGHIDIDSLLLDKLDIILGSLHEPVIKPSTQSKHTDIVVKAMASGKIDIFAHGGNPAFPIDTDEIARTAAYYNVAVEINNSSLTTSRHGSEKNCTALARAVHKYNGKISFGSDAHIATSVGKFDECCELIKDIDFPEESFINGSSHRFLSFLRKRGRLISHCMTTSY